MTNETDSDSYVPRVDLLYIVSVVLCVFVFKSLIGVTCVLLDSHNRVLKVHL